MVDTLVSGASASRRVGSTPISGTRVQHLLDFFLYIPHASSGLLLEILTIFTWYCKNRYYEDSVP